MTDHEKLLFAVLKAEGYSDTRSIGIPEWSVLETIMVLFRQPGEVRERRFKAFALLQPLVKLRFVKV